MKVVIYWESPAEERAAVGMIGPVRRWVGSLAESIWQGHGKLKFDVTARASLFDVESTDEYTRALERAVFVESP